MPRQDPESTPPATPQAMHPQQCKAWGKAQEDCLVMLMNVMEWKFIHKN